MSYKKAIIVSAPSGAGKTTIVHYLLSQVEDLSFSISACSRLPRPQEADGVNYYFLSIDEFKRRINNNDFLEWEEVYSDMFYGTLKVEVERLWSLGKTIIFDVDVKGAISLKNYFGNNGLSIFISPPSLESLSERLQLRATESQDSLKKRLDKASNEMTYQSQFDMVLINDHLETCQEEALTLVNQFIKG